MNEIEQHDGPREECGVFAVYGHEEGCSVTGGVVYRGSQYPFLDGHYVFTDFCSGRLWALAPGGPNGWTVAEVGRTAWNVVAFGEDDRGEVWAVDLANGALLRLGADPTLPAPRRGAGALSPAGEATARHVSPSPRPSGAPRSARRSSPDRLAAHHPRSGDGMTA